MQVCLKPFMDDDISKRKTEWRYGFDLWNIIKYSKQSFVLSSQVNIINNRLYSFEITF